jgi:hypothetical protein
MDISNKAIIIHGWLKPLITYHIKTEIGKIIPPPLIVTIVCELRLFGSSIILK